MQTKSREASITSFWSRKLLSIFCLPGHQMQEILWQCGAADMRRIGRLVRLASAKPVFSVPYQTIPPWALGIGPGGGPNTCPKADMGTAHSPNVTASVDFILPSLDR